MPRISRKEYKEYQVFHIMVQGINKSSIFDKEREKNEYIKLMRNNKSEYKITIIAYCIMNNHAHILLKTSSIENLTKYMHKLNTSYGIYYNKNNERVGFVYRNRFESQAIMDINYLYNCILYIHNNPVNAGLCELAYNYKFSSYLSFIKQNRKIFNRLFNNELEYENAHKNRKTELFFIEYEDDRDREIIKDINNYLDARKRNIIEFKVDNTLLIPIASRLKHVYQLSNVKIAKYLGVSREKIRRIIN
ncbi:MAG: transposase [Clostridia bacterium]|nr:transposase [Clostridia bacterium]